MDQLGRSGRKTWVYVVLSHSLTPRKCSGQLVIRGPLEGGRGSLIRSGGEPRFDVVEP